MTEPVFDARAVSLLMPLQGCHNFRSVSGWRTMDGRRVAPGLLWRASGLDRLTEPDLAALRSLDIGHVFDLRAARERDAARTRWPQDMGTQFWSGAESAAEAELSSLMAGGASHVDDFRVAMTRVYSRFPDDFPQAVNAAVHAVLDSRQRPVLLHCTAGKDRTGFVTAMLLHAVGVGAEDVMADYLLSNASFATARTRFDFGGQLARIEAALPGAVDVLLGVHAEYLLAATDRVLREHGSYQAWLADRAGIDAPTLDALKERMLA